MNYDFEHLQIGEDENSTKIGYAYNLWITFKAKRRKCKPLLGPECSMTMTTEHRRNTDQSTRTGTHEVFTYSKIAQQRKRNVPTTVL